MGCDGSAGWRAGLERRSTDRRSETGMRTELNYRTFVIANPAAAAGEVERKWGLVERLLEAQIPELDAAFTEGPGHATLLAREALRSGWEMIVCVGGDGTLNEVVNGFFEARDPEENYYREEGWIRRRGEPELEPINPDAVLGVVPIGTGGDFRRSVGLMGGIRETIEHMGGRDTRPVDLGEMAYVDFDGELCVRYFLNIASAGFSGSVDQITNEMWKGLGGKASFALASLRGFLGWSNVEVDAIIDETIERSGPLFNFVVANGEFFGGGMWVAPGAQIDDGEFQVVEMGDLSKWQIAAMLDTIYRGRHLRYENVERYRATRVSARPADPEEDVRIDLDGETPGRLPAYWSNHHHAIDLKF